MEKTNLTPRIVVPRTNQNAFSSAFCVKDWTISGRESLICDEVEVINTPQQGEAFKQKKTKFSTLWGKVNDAQVFVTKFQRKSFKWQIAVGVCKKIVLFASKNSYAVLFQLDLFPLRFFCLAMMKNTTLASQNQFCGVLARSTRKFFGTACAISSWDDFIRNGRSFSKQSLRGVLSYSLRTVLVAWYSN